MGENNNPFRSTDPFREDRDLTYMHIGFTKRITWNYQYFLMAVLALLWVSRWVPVRSGRHSGWTKKFLKVVKAPPAILSGQFTDNGSMLTVAAFYIINGFVMFYKLPFNDPFNTALRAGLVSGSNVPLLYLIPLKSGPLLHLFHHSYEHMIIYHKWVGILVVVTALFHGAVFVYLVTWEYSTTNYHMLTGYATIAMFLLISASSARFFRTRFYEMFYFIHLASFVIFLPIFFNHHYVCKTFVIIVTSFLLYDRFVRYIWHAWCLNCEITTTSTDGAKFVLIDIDPNPDDFTPLQRGLSFILLKYRRSFHWKPSNHLFITIPAINSLQSHPFTIASLPIDGNCQLLIQVHDGFTKRLYDQTRTGKRKFMCLVNGPYGTSNTHLPELFDAEGYANPESVPLIMSKAVTSTLPREPTSNGSSFSSLTPPKEKLVLLAGGVGVSLTLPLLKLYGSVRHYDVSFIWITRHDLLTPHINLDTSHNNVMVWNSVKRGRPDIYQLLLDSTNGHEAIHIIGCGSSSLMKLVRQFAADQMEYGDVNLILEEFSF